jgi:succinate dehydrogenase / fumarate reductase, cytochrome b subunit
VTDVRDALMVARNTDGKLTSRPLSPHLQVWRWSITMALSIAHRVTGVGLGIGTLLLTWWLVAAATSDDAFAAVQWFLGTPIGMFVLFCWTLSLLLHLCTGIRHLAWEAGYGFEKQTAARTGWIVVIVAVVATLAIWLIGATLW